MEVITRSSTTLVAVLLKEEVEDANQEEHSYLPHAEISHKMDSAKEVVSANTFIQFREVIMPQTVLSGLSVKKSPNFR